jgi:hypothetical protein
MPAVAYVALSPGSAKGWGIYHRRS